MQPVASTSRILYDVPCAVCGDHSSGKHYGIFACDGCAGFFKRSVRRDRKYACKARTPGLCLVDKAHRNQCRACRFARCLAAGMNRDAVQHERGPRNSTVRRHMSMFLDAMPPGTSANLRAADTRAAETTRPVTNQLTPPLSANAQPFPFPYNSGPIFRGPLFGVPRDSPPPFLTPLSLDRFDPDALCEGAARLLFMNVTWAKNVPGFDSLSLSDRIVLLQASWKDLFILGCAQYLYPMSLIQFLDGSRMISIAEIQLFESVLNEVVKIRPDANEIFFLRPVALFRTAFNDTPQRSNPRRFQDLQTIANFQEQSQLSLKQYSTRTYPMEPGRYSRLLRLIPLFDTVSCGLIVDLFFKNTIGHIAIERIIGDMYLAGKNSD